MRSEMKFLIQLCSSRMLSGEFGNNDLFSLSVFIRENPRQIKGNKK